MVIRQPGEFNASQWRARIRPTGGLCAMLLVAVVVTVSFLGLETSARFADMKNSWITYSAEAEKKGVWISDLRGQFGYGGMIHHFKNYVLRRDKAYLNRLQDKVIRLDEIIGAYLASRPTEAERDALLRIRATADLYAKRIPVITRSIADNLDVERIDALVRVDDRDAFAALAELEQIWRGQRESALTNVIDAIGDGETLTQNVATTLAVLVGLALLIFGLLHMLIGQSLKAANRLAVELKARKRAQETEKKLTRAIEQSPATIIITNVDGNIEYVNRKLVDLTGYDREDLIGNTPRMLQSGHTGDDTYTHIWSTLKAHRSWRGVFKNRKKDGGHYWTSTVILPLLDDDGKITNFIGIGEDITEKKLAREQVAKAQKMEAVGVLAGGIAHDFNNVLMAIIGNVQLARMSAEEIDGETSEVGEVIDALNHIEIASKRAHGLVRQLLTFARRQPTRPRRIALQKQVQEVLELIRASVPANIELTIEGDVGDAAIEADPTVLHQIVMNLCRNAAEALGGKNGRITLRLGRGAIDEATGLLSMPGDATGVLRLDIIDNGPGMPKSVVDRVFDPFFSTKPVGKGTGLGLSVVRNAMDDLNGRVDLKSKVGEGTCFSLHFTERSAVSEEVQTKPVLQGGHERILLVDDEEDVLYVMRRMLTRLGYRVDAYSDPLHLLTAFETHPERFDCLIADFMMPGLCGPDLIASVRRIRPDLPAVLCSAYHGKASDQPLQSGTVRLEKPVTYSDLSVAVRQVLDEHVFEAAQ